MTAEFHTSSLLGEAPELPSRAPAASAEEKGQKGTKLLVEDWNNEADVAEDGEVEEMGEESGDSDDDGEDETESI